MLNPTLKTCRCSKQELEEGPVYAVTKDFAAYLHMILSRTRSSPAVVCDTTLHQPLLELRGGEHVLPIG